MAYSRWIDSKFYTYWAGQANSKEDEVFVVHYDLETYRSFTYTECKQMMDDTLRIKGKMNFIDNDEEAKEILDVEDVIASILLVEDLRIQKN